MEETKSCKGKSRLDMIFTAGNILTKIFILRWGRYDHASISCAFSFEPYRKPNGKPILKDWAISQENFILRAPHIVAELCLITISITGLDSRMTRICSPAGDPSGR